MRVLQMGDFNFDIGGGYHTILAGLGTELSNRGHQVVQLGLGAKSDEHHYPFAVIPSDKEMLPPQARACVEAMKPDLAILVGDLSTHQAAVPLFVQERIRYAGIFPLEGAPLLHPSPWSKAIEQMDLPYAISEFGRDTAIKAGVKCRWLPIGIDEFWHRVDDETVEQTRSMLRAKDRFIVISVCDNQERKNLPCAIKAVSLLRAKGVNAFFVLVTKKRPRYIGWELWPILKDCQLDRHAIVLESSCTRERLRELYSAADVNLLTSKAEGLGLPLFEAMACGTPSVATGTCAIPQILEGRGLTINAEYEYIDPFGNTRRVYASAEHAAEQLYRLAQDKGLREEFVEHGLAYVQQFTWQRSVDVLEKDLNELPQSQGPSGPAGVAGHVLIPSRSR